MSDARQAIRKIRTQVAQILIGKNKPIWTLTLIAVTMLLLSMLKKFHFPATNLITKNTTMFLVTTAACVFVPGTMIEKYQLRCSNAAFMV